MSCGSRRALCSQETSSLPFKSGDVAITVVYEPGSAIRALALPPSEGASTVPP